jgi:hypothetical protein
MFVAVSTKVVGGGVGGTFGNILLDMQDPNMMSALTFSIHLEVRCKQYRLKRFEWQMHWYHSDEANDMSRCVYVA